MRNLKLKNIIAMAMICIMSTAIYGCEKSNISNNKNNTEVEETNKNNEVKDESKSELKDDKKDDKKDDIENSSEEVNKKDTNNKDTNNKDTNNKEEETNTQVKTEVFKLYSKDANEGQEIYLGEVEINKNDSLKNKLTILANTLSEKAFSGLPITLTEIKEVNGKKIAVFDLNEIGNNAGDTPIANYKGVNWYNNYFAGSTGGDITQYTLINNLLQKNYSGNWIDGVKFTYKGKKIEFDHVPELGETNF